MDLFLIAVRRFIDDKKLNKNLAGRGFLVLFQIGMALKHRF